MVGNISQLLSKLESSLGPFIYESGSVLYSSPETLKPGRFYFIAFNPGGKPTDDPRETIKFHTESLKEGYNAFLREDWSSDKRKYACGQAPHQKNVQALARLLGVQIENLFATELIFLRSWSADGVDYTELAKKCWRVHQWMLEIVQPSVIVSNGNADGKSAYTFVLNTFRGEGLAVNELKPAQSGHGRFWLKAARIQGNQTVNTVLGIPHLSYYHLFNQPYNSIVDSWLKATINEHPV
jgi:hypothetical protein